MGGYFIYFLRQDLMMPGWPWSPNLPAYIALWLGLQACTTMPSSGISYVSLYFYCMVSSVLSLFSTLLFLIQPFDPSLSHQHFQYTPHLRPLHLLSTWPLSRHTPSLHPAKLILTLLTPLYVTLPLLPNPP